MLKKSLTAILFTMSICTTATAQMTPTAQERQSMYQALEKSLYANINFRATILMIVQGYAYQNVDMEELSLNELKIYNLAFPQVQQCIVNEFTKKQYQQSLNKGLDYYFKQVDNHQFKQDLAYLTDAKRVQFFDYSYRTMKHIANNADTLNALTLENSATMPAHIEKQFEQLEKEGKQYQKIANDYEDLMDDSQLQPLAELLGVSEVNPFDEHTYKMTVNPMVHYYQAVLDNCHKPIWNDIKSGKMPYLMF